MRTAISKEMALPLLNSITKQYDLQELSDMSKRNFHGPIIIFFEVLIILLFINREALQMVAAF